MTTPRRFWDPLPGIAAEPTLRTSAGMPVTAVLTVTNNAAEPRVLAVTAMGVDADWLPHPVRTRPVLPGHSETVELTVTPAVGAVPARYPMAVAVQSLDPVSGEATAQPAIAEMVVILDAPGQVTLALSPADSTAVFGRRIDIVLRNAGGTPANVDLETLTPTSARVRLRTPRLRILPGETVHVPGRVSARRARMFGSRVRHAYTVTARSAGAPRHAEGSFTARAVLGPTATKVTALLAVVAVWVALAIVFVPKIADRFGSHANQTVAQNGGGNGGTGSNGGNGGTGSNGGNGGGGGSGGNGGGSGGNGSAGGASANQLALNGTISGIAPGGVSVVVSPTTFNDALGAGAQPVGVASATVRQLGKLSSDGLRTATPADAQNTIEVTSSSDGTFSVPPLPKRGYYLVTFAKSGFQTVRYVVDASSPASTQPLAVTMNAGEGRLNGTVSGPGGPLGAATITITDGHTTTTTTTNSRGAVGSWSVQGLSTPASYLVTATYDGLATESRLVALGPAASASVALTLHSGVVSLSGRITGTDDGGAIIGLGGATVTATSNDTSRSVTTLTEDGVAGDYILPELPAGTYTVTVSAPGYISQTSKLDLREGSADRRLSTQLTLATATVFGVISGAESGGAVGQVGAGLVLTSPTNVYKTTTTSDPAGSFTFSGVEPGTYVLTAEMFGFKSDTVTIVATAGGHTEVNRTLELVVGGVLPATAEVQGSAVDALTGNPVTPPPNSDFGPGCDKTPLTQFKLTAVVIDTPPDGSASKTYCTNFLPGEQYTLPDVTTNPDDGLLPGLHTITITAAGYEGTSVQVSVPLGGIVKAPTAQLYPAPRLVGLVTSAKGVPAGPSCVWAVGKNGPSAPQPCGATGSPEPGCPTTLPADSACTSPSGTADAVGNYTLVLPVHGAYQVYLSTADPDYQTASDSLAVAPQSVTFGLGQVVPYQFTLHRSGHLSVVLQVPGPDGNLQTLQTAGAKVQVIGPVPGSGSPCAASSPVVDDTTADSTGIVNFTGLNGSYAVKASFTDPSTGAAESGCISVDMQLDEDDSELLPLISPLGNLVGRVVYFLDSTKAPVSGATVTVTGIYSYKGTQALTRTWTMTTDAHGCFAIRSTAAPANSTSCPSIANEEVDDSFGNSTSASPVGFFTSNGQLLSFIISITATRTGFSTLQVPAQAQSDPVNEFAMAALPVPFTSSGTTNTLQASPATLPAPTGAAITVVRKSDNTSGGITVSKTADATVTNAVDLTWHDPAIEPAYGPNFAQPGAYTLTATLAGYQTAQATLTCVVLPAPSCVLSSFVLLKDVELDITPVDSSGNQVPGAQLTIYDGTTQGTSGTSDGTNPVPFQDLTPNHSGYQVIVVAAGYRFSVAPTSTAAAVLNYTLECGGSATPLTGIPPITEGGTLSCTATLQKLGTITGTATGVVQLASSIVAGTTPVTSPIGGATVTAQLCSQTGSGTDPVFGGTVQYCTAVSGSKFTTTSAASTSTSPGTFTLTGSATQQGLLPGTYLVSVTNASGYCAPSTTAVGTCPQTLPTSVDDGNGNSATPLAGVVVTVPTPANSGDDVGTVTGVVPELFEQPAVAVFKATTLQGNKTLPATGLTMTIATTGANASPLTAVESPAGTYTFAQVLPNLTYSISASSDVYALTSHQQLITLGGGPYPFTIGKTNNEVKGTVIGLQDAATVPAALQGVTVSVVTAGAGACSGTITAVTGNDGQPLQATTDGSGQYDFTAVPNVTGKNKYQVCAVQYGYLTGVSTSFSVTNNAVSTQDFTLTRMTYDVTITLNASSVSDDITGVSAAELISSTAAGVPHNSDLTSLSITTSSDKHTVTISKTGVPYGCWSFGITLPAKHFGTIGNPQNVSPAADTSLNCASDEFEVLGTGTGTGTATVTYTLTEYRLTVDTTATSIDPDPVPDVVVSVGPAATPLYSTTISSPTSGQQYATVIWVAAGTYAVRARVPSASANWNTTQANDSVTLPDTSTTPPTTTATSTLSLTEKGGRLTVDVTGASSTDQATVSITCSDSTASCTTAQQASDSGSGASFSGLPVSVTWSISATLDGNTVTEDGISLTGGSLTTINVPSSDTTPTYFPASLTVNVTGAKKSATASVVLHCESTSAPGTSCGADASKTDSGNGVTFSGLIPGTYTVTATLGANSVSQGVTLTDDQSLTITVPGPSSTPTSFPPPPPSTSATPTPTPTTSTP
jgi:uncharacterized membrane protein YgcG